MKIRQWLFLTICIALGIALTGRLFRRVRLSAALIDAIQRKASPETVASLISDGANPNAIDRHSVPVLVMAASVGPSQTVTILLDAGASLDAHGPGGVTPAIGVATSNVLTKTETTVILHDLKQHGEDLEERDQFGMTPFLHAVWSRNAVAARTLLDLGANIHALNYQHHSAWDFIKYGDPKTSGEMVDLLRTYETRRQAIHSDIK